MGCGQRPQGDARHAPPQVILDHTPPALTPARWVFRDPEVLRVVDGDSLHLRCAVPFDGWRDLEVRLLGVDAPERVGASRQAGEAAKMYLSELLEHAEELRAQTYKTDKFGRYLCEIWVRHGPTWLNVSAALIEAGHGVPYNGGPR